ncbi:MAG: sugar porter family MFS transporter [Oceanipulchritudo sp.]
MTTSTPVFLRVLFLSCVAALGGFLFGYDSGVINGTVTALSKAFDSSNLGSGLNVSSMLLGCAAGAFLAGRIADRFGRKAALLTAAILFAISSWGSGIAPGSMEFIFFRLLGGFAVGAASIICPAYISEIAPPGLRGRLATLQQMAIVLGLFSAFLVNYILANTAGGASEVLFFGFQTWQWMFWAELIPVSVFFTGLLFIPESPRYLVASGKSKEAKHVLISVSSPEEAEKILKDIEASLEVGHRPRFADLVDKETKTVHPIVWVGIFIAALQQLVGINVVFYYGEVLWSAAGFSVENALLINVIGGIINVSATVGAILLVDKWGRKPLLILGGILMAFFLSVLAGVFASADIGPGGDLQLGSTAGVVALISANLYIVGFGLSWGPVMWVLLGEMFPNRLRGAALSLAGLTQWSANFLVTMTFPLLLAGIGLGGAYGIYALFAAIATLYAWKIVPETKGRTLEQMSNSLASPDDKDSSAKG